VTFDVGWGGMGAPMALLSTKTFVYVYFQHTPAEGIPRPKNKLSTFSPI